MRKRAAMVYGIQYVDGRTDMRFVGSEEEAFVAAMDELKNLKYIAAGNSSAARRISHRPRADGRTADRSAGLTRSVS